MRKFWVLAGFLFVLAFAQGSRAADDNVLQVTVHASVKPACYVIVSPNNQITEIISNSSLEVTPAVYFGHISPQHRRNLTASIYTQYLLLTKHHNHVGIVYFSPHDMNSNQTTNNVAAETQSSFVHKLIFLKRVGSLYHA